jgi:hypothetical protein
MEDAMRRVKDLEDWPPQPGGFAGRGYRHPATADQSTIKEVGRIVNNTVNFSCAFDGREERYHFHVPDAKTAGQVASILEKHKGEPLISTAYETIPEE